MSSNRICRAPALLLVVTLALVGCSKSEPAPETKTAPLTASAQPAAPAANADKPAATPAPTATPTPVTPPGKPPEVTRVKLPEDVVAVLAFRSLDGVLNSAKTALEMLDPANAQPGFISATKEGIKESLGWKDIAWIQADKPIRLMLFNAKQYEGKAQFMALPMSSKEAVLAALPDGARQKDGDHVAKYDNNGQTVFVDFVEGHAIYTDHESFFAKGKPFFEAQLRGWLPSRSVELKIDLDNVYALFLPELSEAKRQLIASYSDVEGKEPTGLNRLLAFEVESLFSLFESSHQADLNLWFDQKTFNVSGAFLPKAATVLDTFRASNVGRKIGFAKFVPKTGMFNTAVNMDFSKLDGMMKAIDQVTIDAYKEVADLRPEDIALIETHLKVMAQQAMGDAVISIYADKEFPGAVAAVAKFNDPVKILNAWSGIFDVVFPRMMAKMKAEGGSDVPPELGTAKSLSDLIPLLNEMGGALGVKLGVVQDKADGNVINGLKVSMDWARFAAATQLDKGDPELFTALKGILGNQFAATIGYNAASKLGSLTFGPNAMDVSKALLSGAEFGGGESGMMRAAGDNMGVVTIRMETMLKAVSFIPGLAAKVDLIKKVPAERPIVATIKADDKQVGMQVSLPVDVMQVLGDIQK
ncbi:MAG: hypothetical protein ACPGU1_13980 [Myxococcota bacterium]